MSIPTARPAGAIQVKRLERRTMIVPIRGTAPLICHKWSEKAKLAMLKEQMGEKAPKTPKDPVADYESTLYYMPDGDGFGYPAVAFKSAMVGAARLYDKLPMTALRPALFVMGEGPENLVRINGKPEPREDMVRLNGKMADIRFRGAFTEWSAELRIVFLESAVTETSVLALVDASGMGGIGEWRPSKADTGSFGTYVVEMDKVVVTE